LNISKTKLLLSSSGHIYPKIKLSKEEHKKRKEDKHSRDNKKYNTFFKESLKHIHNLIIKILESVYKKHKNQNKLVKIAFFSMLGRIIYISLYEKYRPYFDACERNADVCIYHHITLSSRSPPSDDRVD